jgi:hypothetical protein
MKTLNPHVSVYLSEVGMAVTFQLLGFSVISGKNLP